MNPSKIMQRLGEAAELFEKGEVDQAEKICKQVLLIDEHNFYALNFYGCICRAKSDFPNATYFLEKAASQKPNNPDVIYNLANVFKDVGEWEKAAFYYSNSINLRPNFTEAFNNLGICLKELECFEKSQIALIRAVEIQPKFASAWLNLGNTYKEQSKYQNAIDSYRKAIMLEPALVDAYLGIGLVCKLQGSDDEAIANYRKAVEIKPDFVPALSALAGELVIRGEHKEAHQIYMRALVKDPEHTNSVAGLGWSFIKSGLIEEAVKYYSNLLRKSELNTDAYFFLFTALGGNFKAEVESTFSYRQTFLEKAMKLMGASKIIAFGDSHVQLFDGYDQIEVNHVGASTAYNLTNKSSSTAARQQVFNRIRRINSNTEVVLLCFGEVDIRANIIKYCYRNESTIEDSVKETVGRYISFAQEIASQGIKVLIYGGYGAGSGRTSIGSDRERNYAAMQFNLQLAQQCFVNSYAYFSLYDLIFDAGKMKTDHAFMADGFHLHCNKYGSKKEVQLLLFERAYAAVKNLYTESTNMQVSQLVLGNVACLSPLQVGTLASNKLSWKRDVYLLESIVFDMCAVIRFESMVLGFKEVCELNRLQVFFDGRPISVQAVQVEGFRWKLQSSQASCPLIGRYLTLKGPSSLLLLISEFFATEYPIL